MATRILKEKPLRYEHREPYVVGDLLPVPDEGYVKEFVLLALGHKPEVRLMGRSRQGNRVSMNVGTQYQPSKVVHKDPERVKKLLRTIYTVQPDGSSFAQESED